jgi:CheY-like chemotaxis protein
MKSTINNQSPEFEPLSQWALQKDEATKIRPPPNFLQVLIVDDNKRTNAANGKLINGLGHGVSLAHSGISALRMAAKNRPDVVLLNHDLLTLEGRTVVWHLRSDFFQQPPLFICLATKTNRLMRQQCVEAGLDLVLQAPLNIEAIETLLLFECAKLNTVKKAAFSKGLYEGPLRAPVETLASTALEIQAI